MRITFLTACALSLATLTGCVQAAEPRQAVAKPATEQESLAGRGSGYVWWEGETPSATNFPPGKPFGPDGDTETAILSGGNWIATTGDRSETLFLEYQITVPKAGGYDLYVRKFWQHGPFRWRIGATGAWHEVREAALLDDAFIRQFVGANWVSAGSETVAAGKQTVRIELLDKKGAAAFDAFVLTAEPFTARGKLKPGEKYNRTELGWFAWEPDADAFSGSPIDLRGLNETEAGATGRIVVKGEGFAHDKSGKGERFWAVNAGGDFLNLPPAQMDYLARHLSKYGVNMVRLHGGMWKDSDFREPDMAKIDKLQRFVAAMKKQGVYTSISMYFPLWLKPTGIPGYNGDKNPFALLFFNDDFQKVYRGWWKAILTTKSPYSGMTFAEDPAVAFAELVNEDSNLFWTFTPYQNIPAEQMPIIEKQFGDWLAKKYGGVDKAFTAWGGSGQRGDDANAGRAGFMPLYDVFNKRDARSQDTARFLAENQAQFFSETAKYLKSELGYKGLVYGSNWITADSQRLGPLDKLSNIGSGLDFLDRHGYFDTFHEGERAGYSLNNGEKYDDRTALTFQAAKRAEGQSFNMPLMDLRHNDLPSIITEINYPMPNRFRAEQPLLNAAYGSLQGSDGIFHFALSGPTWQGTHGKFDLQTPATFGQFPAAALIYRKGMVAPGPKVVTSVLKMDDLYALNGAPVQAPMNLEAFRAKDIPPGQAVPVAKVDSIDPLAFLVGKVGLTFDATGTAKSSVVDLTKFIDKNKKVVRSATGELAWNYADGRMVVNTKQAQGVTGFLSKGGKVTLGDVSILSPLEYGTVLVVALDEKPIATSGKLLLQVMTEDKNYGWQTEGEPDGVRTIKNIGTAPILVKNIGGTVSLSRADAASLTVTALDANGYKTNKVGTAKLINLLPNALYYVIEKK
ncbi:MAG: hypothetical protein H8F28_18070 [Fibrella sp.]|nr:hypothetical protein [Armatimonadota bacterium]